MDVLKKSIDELAANFSTRMDEFQKEVRTTIPAATPSSNLSAQFELFRSFMMTALENLQLQLQLLARQQDDMEVRSRRKMLLVHGMQETREENPAQYISKLLAERLCISDITADSFSRCHRMGRSSNDKPRPLLIKFREQDLRDKAWFAKTKLKGSGVTLSEFLTKSRHDAFVLARRRFGISRTWTRDGCVLVLGSDGKRHRAISAAEVNAIADPTNITSGAGLSTAVTHTSAQYVNTKPRKQVKK